MLKFKLAALAVIIAAGGAFATVKKSAFAAHKWSLDQQTGVYTDVTGQQEGINYDCDDLGGICTQTFQDGQNPNSDNSNPISTESGVFN